MKYGDKFGSLMVVAFTKDKRPVKEREGHAGMAIGYSFGDRKWYVFSVSKRSGGDWIDYANEFDSFPEAHKLFNELPDGHIPED